MKIMKLWWVFGEDDFSEKGGFLGVVRGVVWFLDKLRFWGCFAVLHKDRSNAGALSAFTKYGEMAVLCGFSQTPAKWRCFAGFRRNPWNDGISAFSVPPSNTPIFHDSSSERTRWPFRRSKTMVTIFDQKKRNHRWHTFLRAMRSVSWFCEILSKLKKIVGEGGADENNEISGSFRRRRFFGKMWVFGCCGRRGLIFGGVAFLGLLCGFFTKYGEMTVLCGFSQKPRF